MTRLGLVENGNSELYSAFALLGTFCSIICSAAVLLFVSRYLVALMPVTPRRKKIGDRLISFLVALYLVLCLFSVFFVNSGDWIAAFDMVLNELFISGSVILSIHGVIALFFIRNAENREHADMMRAISMTFLPLIPFFILDLIFLRDMTFKLTYISYTIFCVNIYLFVSRNYFRKWAEPVSMAVDDFRLPSENEFSPRERDILLLLIEGKTNREIGESLFHLG